VLDGRTGLVVGGGRSRAERAQAAAAAIGRLLDDDALRRRWGCQARRHAETAHDYDVLARRLAEALA
jgi:glycosyltransferase involved in cell wall biosynthesis